MEGLQSTIGEMQATMRQQDLRVAELERKVEQLVQQNAQSESSQGILLKANECLQIAMAQLQSIMKQQDLKITQFVESSERSPILVQRGTPDQKVKGPVLADSSSPVVHTLPHEPYIPQSLLESVTMVRQAKERAREEQCIGISRTVYSDPRYYQSIQTFERSSEVGTLLDDAIREGRIVEEKPLPRKRSSSVYFEPQESYDVKSLYASSTTASSHKRVKKGNDRQFTPIKMSLSAAFHLLVQKGHLQPFQPGKPSKRPPPGHDESKFCDFHQERGHATDGCRKLRHAIQNLVDDLPHPNSLHFLGLN